MVKVNKNINIRNNNKNYLKIKLLPFKITTFHCLQLNFHYFRLKQKKKTQLFYYFYDFVFDLNFIKYALIYEVLIKRLNLLKGFQVSFNKSKKRTQVKNFYFTFLSEKNIFIQYSYESNFLKYFYFNHFFNINFLKRQKDIHNPRVLTQSNQQKLTTSKIFSNFYPFTDCFFKNISKKIGLEKNFKILPNFVIKSYTLRLYFKELKFQDIQVSSKISKYINLETKIKKNKKNYQNWIKTNFFLHYCSKLQIEIHKFKTYLGLKRFKNYVFLFFKLHKFLLKYITNSFQLKLLDMYLMSKDELDLNCSKLLSVSKLTQTYLKIFQKNVINSESKSLVLMIHFLFLKNLIFKNFSFKNLNTFYYSYLLADLAKGSKKKNSSFLNFLKQLNTNKNLFLNKKQKLFLLKSQKISVNKENDFLELTLTNLLIDKVWLIYKHFQFQTKCYPFICRNCEPSLFLNLNKTLTKFLSLFLKILFNRKFDSKLFFYSHFQKEILETYVFDKFFQLTFWLLTIAKTNKLTDDSKLIYTCIKPLVVKQNPKNFFKTIKNAKKFCGFYFRAFFSIFTLTKVFKNSLFLKYNLKYSTRLIYIEQTRVQLLILTNENLKIEQFLHLIKNIQSWFLSGFNSSKLTNDIYFYNFQTELESTNLSLNQLKFQINNRNSLSQNKTNKLIFIYNNHLVILLRFTKVIKLPVKFDQEIYINLLKKTFKDYSNKNQSLLINALSERIYVWVYNYRFILINNYFLQLDRYVFQSLWKWGIRRHNNKSKNWIKNKYFFQTNQNYLIFGICLINNKDSNKLHQSTKFVYLPLHLQIFLNFKIS